MPAVLLATLYEYSPPFHIAVVAICFFLTCGLVLGWFRVDVPVILRTSDDSASNPFLARRQMVQVKNPFGLEIVRPDVASVTAGVTLRVDCLEESVLTCYWGCSVPGVQEALHKHAWCYRIATPGGLEEALHNEYRYREQHDVQKESKEEIVTRLPEDKMEDFGPLPRARYPLVALLTLRSPEDRELYPIVSMLSVIHLPDPSYRMPCRILCQYLLTARGHYYDLKQLYMSVSEPTADARTKSDDRTESSKDAEILRKLGLSEEEESEGGGGKDCVVCQNDTVNWALLPCRHVCLCDGCLTRFQHCPICRHFVQETFPLRQETFPLRQGTQPD